MTSIWATVPARATVSSFSIFIASTTIRPWRASTLSPTATSTFTTLPGIGATMRWSPLPGPRIARARRRRFASATGTA